MKPYPGALGFKQELFGEVLGIQPRTLRGHSKRSSNVQHLQPENWSSEEGWPTLQCPKASSSWTNQTLAPHVSRIESYSPKTTDPSSHLHSEHLVSH